MTTPYLGYSSGSHAVGNTTNDLELIRTPQNYKDSNQARLHESCWCAEADLGDVPTAKDEESCDSATARVLSLGATLGLSVLSVLMGCIALLK